MLEDTGERIIPELMKPTNGMLLEHLARYYFAAPYVNGTVLDFATGAGYGAHMIAKLCKSRTEAVLGVDIDPAVVEYARQTYYHPLVSYAVHDVLDPKLSQQIGPFDTILSFETVEHIADDERFMQNCYDLLKPGGTLVLSSPFGAGRGKPCLSPWHVHQYTEDEFRQLFRQFDSVEYYYQHGVLFEPKREGVRYPFGIAVCKK
ncbi:SAM-dependent methyltransferase [Tumebacillus algifaecis]|uniref:SAM-dependent methyltransferase n=1 Tax=Tumebacillus algifaecis TaxID=1214604 RepID=A0A223CXN0_9BACL|nr:class I SAM-dependent methyltransferase [Tumebacillus algifaecis]ASS74051.1 SAM-dependent methyltransferase [Tumebacillus algifaecis]